MATAGDGAAYGSIGTGGKFQKKPFRRGAQATPYDRPPTALRINYPTLLTKLVDPASRIIYAGANKLFGVFHKRLSPPSSRRLPETNEESKNELWLAGPKNGGVSEYCTGQDGNMASVSATTEISELEKMLKHNKFTRSEIERLTALLHSKTTESPSDGVVEREGAKLPNTTSHVLRTQTSTSGTLQQLGEERVNIDAAISTPVSSRVLNEDFTSPAELAKAYMGTRPTNLAPSPLGLSSQPLRQDSMLLDNATVLPKTPIISVTPKTTNSFRALENGFTTPRSRGRSAIYSMSHTPYSRGLSTFGQKSIKTDYGRGVASPSLTLSHSARRHEGPFWSNKMALKRRISVLDDDIGSGDPVRRIRHKADLLSQGSYLSKNKREFGSRALQRDAADQQLLLMNEHEQKKASKSIEENGETSMRGLGNASVPTKSIQMATKILQQLERLSPKERSSGSRLAEFGEKSSTKLTSNILHGQALRIVDKVDSPKFLPSHQNSQKPEVQHHEWLPDTNTKSNEKAEDNDSRKFSVPRNMLSSLNHESTVPLRDNAPFISTTDSKLKLLAEPPQKKCAFQMGVQEIPLELDDEIHSNGHASIPLAEDKKMKTSLVANKDVFAEALSEVTQTPVLPEVTKAPALHETTPASPEVTKAPALPELNKFDDNTLPTKTEFGPPGGSADSEQKTMFNFPTSPPSSTITELIVLSQSASPMDRVDPQTDSNASSLFGISDKGAEEASPFLFSANESSVFKPDTSPVPKLVSSNSVLNSVEKNDEVKLSASNEDDNVNVQKPLNSFCKSDSLSSNVPTATSSGIFPFGASTIDSSIVKETPTSNPPTFSSSASFPSITYTNQVFTHSPSHVTSSGSTATATTATAATTTTPTTAPTTSAASSSGVISISSPAPVFSFASATAPSTWDLTAPTISVTEAPDSNVTNEEAISNNMSHSSFAIPPLASTSIGSSIFGFSSPASTAITQALPFQFESSTSAPTFGHNSPIMFSSSNTGASIVSSVFSFPNPGQTVFGNLTPGFGSPNNNMETEDSMPPSPAPASAFGQTGQTPEAAPVFVFGSATPTPPANPFQFGCQAFAGGGSFSLGSGGGGVDKSGRRFLRVRSKNRRK